MLNYLTSDKKLNQFCIITTQRSGSTWLVRLLDSHPEITSYPELFIGNPYGKKQWKEQRILPCYLFREQHPYSKRPFIIFRYFNYLGKNTPVNNCQAMGFKVMYDQIGWTPEILINLIIKRYKIIHLIRNNYLDILISRQNAWGKKGNRIVRTSAPVDLRPVNLDVSKIITEMDKIAKEIEKYKFILKYIPNQVMTVTYESLLNNKLTVLKEICSFLEIEKLEVDFQSDLQKISTKTYQEKIANYAEVKNVLKNTKYSVFLENF